MRIAPQTYITITLVSKAFSRAMLQKMKTLTESVKRCSIEEM